MVNIMKKGKEKRDYILLIFITLFMLISIISIYSANTYLPKYLGNLALKQFSYYVLGFILIYIIKKIGNDKIFKFIDILYIINIILLFLLLFIGKSINGSRCWFVIPYIGSIQPSEFMKMILIIKLSKDIDLFFSNDDITIKKEFIFILKSLFIITIPSILTFLEPDTGAVIMYLISSIFIFIFSPFHKIWTVISSIFIGMVVLSFIILYYVKKDMLIDIFGTNLLYRIDRIINWKNGEGMQLENSLTSIGSSYLYGHGFNKTPLYFPESGTDFIFSVFSCNFGLIGSILLIIFIASFDIYLINKIKCCNTIREKMVLIGLISLLIYQQMQNIGMTLGVFPITGITLPFISYGGSSLLSYLFMIGIVLNIKRMHTHP